jgi:archaellum component FlaC
LRGREEGVDRRDLDEIKQHIGVVAGRLESKIELIAEGHALLRAEMKTSIGEVKTEVKELRSEVDVVKHEVGGLNSKVGDLQSDVDVVKSEVGGLRSKVGELKSDVGAFRSEVKLDFSDVRSMIKLSYAEIDTRIGNLERDVADLKERVESVEAAVR